MYSRKAAEAQMDAWGAEGTPFAFILPYDDAEPCLLQPEEVESPAFYYALPGGSRLPHSLPPRPASYQWSPHPVSEAGYRRSFAVVQRHLSRGDSYLVNLCVATPVESDLTLGQVFAHAHAPYRVWLPRRFTCFSPEPFVRMEGRKIRTYPMKGTVAGEAQLPALMAHEKERREHATVVDLLRNDLAIVGSHVCVERYRYAERIPTSRGELWATSSAVSATLPEDWRCRVGSLLGRLLPAGSVTGAPKAWTCRVIAEAETAPRGYYTGVFGRFDGRSLESAVAIRFLEERAPGRYLFRSGGGITLLSDPEAEYREIVEKIYVPFAAV